uniref:PUM-HD domain-containing protein n=1 Tax=Bracon brevicornis TaxID=1563983 RepID=A0A6V7KUQ0_9HYME
MSDTNENHENGPARGLKRKKKRSANQMMKKLARRRNPGHGSELDTESYQYLVRILDLLRTEFPTMEDKLMFVNNVYEQTIGNEIEIAKNQVGSRVLDSLMEYATLEVIQRLKEAFTPALRPICSDCFASHVLEKIIKTCAERGNRKLKSQSKDKNSISVTSDEISKYNTIALNLSKYMINNIEEFVYDTYANHILRTVINCLAGLIDKDDHQKNDKSIKTPVKIPVMQGYTDLLVDAGNRLLRWGKFPEFGKDNLTSGLLQTYLTALKDIDPKLTSSIIKKIITECFKSKSNSEDDSSIIFNSDPASRLLESCLVSSTPEMFVEVYEQLFKGKLKALSLMKPANFSVQRLIDNCPTKEDFEVIFEEISEHLTEILESHHSGVLASLANACLRLQAKQGPFVNVISKTLHCDDSNEKQLLLVSLVSRLVTYEQFQSAKKGNRNIPLDLHGSLIVQAILNFNKPIKIVNSIFSMGGEELAGLFSDPKGSRILDAFMDSKFVGEKSRDKLAKMLKGYWVDLACGIHGSRCIDKIWEHSKDTQKKFIMEELASVGQKLLATKSGKLISHKLNVELYQRSPKSWIEAQKTEVKTKALFADVLGEQ